MDKRQIILEHIKAAGRDGDPKKALRLYVENRISYKAYTQAYVIGLRQAEIIKGG